MEWLGHSLQDARSAGSPPWTIVRRAGTLPLVTVTSDRPAFRSDIPSMTAGRVFEIHIADSAGTPMRIVERVRAIAGVGLEGDRYATRTGHWSDNEKVDRQVTLIAAEELERLAALRIGLAPGETRRNVTTRGIDLNALVGRRFRIGDVECEATRLCEPCQYLTDLVGRPILEPLVHRAGIRARILADGEIAVGDEVVPLD
jgi:MOSC domain-containing protein YiiM